jgi:class 3 adenylate cyclase
VLAEYFSILADIVSAYDGEVLAFIGDAMLAAWFVRAHDVCEYRKVFSEHVS